MSILVVSWDRVGAHMAGSAVRALEIGRALAASGLDVVIAAPEGSDVAPERGLRLATFPPSGDLGRLAAEADVVVISGRIELMTAIEKPLVVDLYDPFILSNLDLFGGDFARSRGRPLLGLRWLQHHLAHGDFFLCASPAQRSFWLGMLAGAGRVNRANYERDPELADLLAVVPFGVPDEPPTPGPPLVKGVVPGIAADDRLVLWAGGMWNWVDPLTLIRATALLRERRPEIKTLVLGTRHPNPAIGEMAMAREAKALARELGLFERGVWFVDWVPYADRGRYILESDVGVSLHRRGVESEFAFRTRLLDHIWGARPIVATAGDDLAARIEREGLGRVVAPEDAAAVARAIEGVLDEPDTGARTARLEAARASLAWSNAIAPLRRFCLAPTRAPDQDGRAWFAAGTPREGLPRKEDALIADEHLSAARAMSPPLGTTLAPVQRFRAVCDDLCQIDVLLWVEPPVTGRNLLFEIFYVEPEARCLAHVVVPAATLPRNGWQRFEFAPLAGSRHRDLEFRLTLVPSADEGEAAVIENRAGRVSVWYCAPPSAIAAAAPEDSTPPASQDTDAAAPEPPPGPAPGAAGEPPPVLATNSGLAAAPDAAKRVSLAFIARYLVGKVAEDLPVSPDAFLFLHNTTVPLAQPLDPVVPVPIGDIDPATASEPPQEKNVGARGAPIFTLADIERMRADLARVAGQAALADQGVRALDRKLDRRLELALGPKLEARVRADARSVARKVVAETLAKTPVTLAFVAEISRWLLGVIDGGSQAVRTAIVLVLSVVMSALSIPLAAIIGAAIAATDAVARLRGRPSAAAGAGADAWPRLTADAAMSVVIPTWNGRELLEMSLPPLVAALRHRGNPRDEIIVVDNGSDDGTAATLARFAADTPELRTITLDSNRGFAGATNLGAREARNPLLLLLNNDMVVEPDFLQPLADAFVAEPGAFGISCQIDFIDPAKPRWETGKVHARLEYGMVRLFHLDRFDEDLLYPVFFAGGGASAYDRARFLALGGFDDDVFSPVYIEDVDLGYRAWKRGWPSLMQPRSRVHHKHRGTTRRLWSEATIHSFFVKNLAALLWKNVDSWRLLGRHVASLPFLPERVRRQQGTRAALATLQGLLRQLPVTMRARRREARVPRALDDGEIFQLSRYRHAYRARFHPEDRDAQDRPQLLIVSPYSPAPAVHGGATRIQNLIREMRPRCDVTLISFFDTSAETSPESLAMLSELCRDAILVPRDVHARSGPLMPDATIGFYSQKMFDEVEAWLDRRRFDVVQVDYTHMSHYLPAPVPGLLRVLVEHDICFVALERARAGARSLARRLALWRDGLRMLRYEVGAVEGADLVLTMSEDDRAALARLVDPGHIAVAPNGVSCRDFPFAHEGREPLTILFVGFFRHEPNVEAVVWFAREVLPLVRARLPEVRFRVVGAYPTNEVRDLATSDAAIEITGMVPETASHYRRATLFVAPILRGSGTRLKILEAMASGCPVVSTALGAEGLGASPAEIAIADTAATFAVAVADLVADPSRRDAMTRAARSFVEQRYDWPAIANRILDDYQIAPAAAERRDADDEPRALAAGGRLG